jgi:DNA-binding NarL/FixJ family response regulator
MNIYLALSNHLFCEGLKKLINEGNVDTILNQEYDNSSAFDADIVLFDQKKDISNLIAQNPESKFVLLDTGLPDLDLACLLLCHHISGIIPQEADQESLCKALKVVHSGEIWIEQKHLKILISKGKELPDGGGVKGLSQQDKRIVEFISQGFKNSEIAERLCLSEPTIKAHISRIYKMLKVKNRVQLACMAQDNPINEV